MHQKTFRFHAPLLSVVAGVLSLLLLATPSAGQQPAGNDSGARSSHSDDAAIGCDHGCGDFGNCRAGGCRGESHLTIHDMWDREPAASNEPQHFSYDTRRLYYYRRPYNTAHVRQARFTSHDGAYFEGSEPASAASDYQARAEIFARVNRELEERYDQSHEEIDGGHLEYVDWQAHQDAKSTWQQERLSEAESEATDDVEDRPNSIRQSLRQLRSPASLR